MRVVEYRKNTQSLAYRSLWALGAIAGLFSLVVCAMMIANHLRLKASDPVHTPALERMLRDLKASPENEALKEQIRELDLLARRAFFTSQRFNQVGIWMLLGGLVVAVVAFKSLSTYHRRLPYPDSHDPKDDLAAKALWARQSVVVAGLVLVGLALSLALPWKSPLDDTPPVAAAPAPPPGNPIAKPEISPLPPPPTLAKLAPQPDTTAARDAPPPSRRDERLKQWPSFRGPASGHAASAKPPTQWDGKSGKGILWKTPIPLPGFGSPIVWGDRIFISGGDKTKRAVYAVDAKTGKLDWERSVPTKITDPASMPEVTGDTGYAAPTMAADGSRVFAVFATGDLAAFDLNGEPLWSQHLGIPANPYGHSSSLEIFEGMLLVQFDHKEAGFVAALDLKTGATRWKTVRKFGPSWASPALIDVEGHAELILIADAFVSSYDPKTGRELWKLECLGSGDVAPSPVFADGLLYVASDHVKFAAIDVKARRIVWENSEDTPGVATPVVSGGFLFAGLGEGGIACWDARTGKRAWLEETDDSFYASPIVAGGRVFQMDRTGRMLIFEATGAGYKPVAQPLLGEEAVATPAVYADSLICRTAKHLYRIGS